MTRELFGTDGVRGLAGQYPLDSEGCQRIGQAVGASFAGAGGQVAIGWDTRESSELVVKDVVAGLTAAGANVVKVGVIPTPGLAYLTSQKADFKAGIMVTASHNPYQYNGIKVFDAQGDKLSDAEEAKLNRLINEDAGRRDGQGSVSNDQTLIEGYESFLIETVPGLQLDSLAIAVDSANGAAAGLAQRLFERLGAKVTALGDQPDGRNINASCGATDTAHLRQIVTNQKLALGIALDGDADRLIMIDELGREVKGDQLLYVLAVTMNLKIVVATVMSNLGFEQALRQKGIRLERTAVGDRYVLEALLRHGYKLGGEQSGHIILPDLLKTGDGLLAAVQVLKALKAPGQSLAEWYDKVPLLPQALVNIDLPDKSALDKPAIRTWIEQADDKFKNQGRLLIRPSGTEPLARVMVEAPNAQALADQLAAELKELL